MRRKSSRDRVVGKPFANILIVTFFNAILVLLALLRSEPDGLLWFTFLVFFVSFNGIFLLLVRQQMLYPWNIAFNLAASIREKDYSMRVSTDRFPEVVSDALHQLNLLAKTLQEDQSKSLDRQMLLRELLRGLDLAVFCLDAHLRIRLVNDTAARLFCEEADNLVGRDAYSLGLRDALSALPSFPLTLRFPAREGRWIVKQGSYHEQGSRHTLLFLADVGQTLREEELNAWKKLIRVVSHEINNSMTPLVGLTHAITTTLSKDPLPADWKSDVCDGLKIISKRVDNMNRFIRDYSAIARIRTPEFQSIAIVELLKHCSAMESRCPIRIVHSSEDRIQGDPSMLEQAFINLIKNAADAMETMQGSIVVSIQSCGDELSVEILDEGPGIEESGNLFTPYFTTKKNGSGIGLFLARQIFEAHSASIHLRNRTDTKGCRAVVIFPIETREDQTQSRPS